jgi:hypothetical protein
MFLSKVWPPLEKSGTGLRIYLISPSEIETSTMSTSRSLFLGYLRAFSKYLRVSLGSFTEKVTTFLNPILRKYVLNRLRKERWLTVLHSKAFNIVPEIFESVSLTFKKYRSLKDTDMLRKI